MEHEEHGLGALGETLLLGDELLGVLEDFGPELDIAGLVHSVHVAEGSGDGEEVGGDVLESPPELVDLVGLRVQQGAVDVAVVDTVLLAAGDAELNLEEAVDGRHALQVVNADLDVLLEGLLGEIEHVGAEEGLSGLLELLLGGLDEAINPREEVLGAMVGVDDDGDTVKLSELADVQGTGDGAGDGGLLVGVVELLAGNKGTAAVGELDDHGGVGLLGSKQAGVGDGGGGAVHGRDGVAVLLGVFKQGHEVLAVDNARLEHVHELRDEKDGLRTQVVMRSMVLNKGDQHFK